MTGAMTREPSGVIAMLPALSSSNCHCAACLLDERRSPPGAPVSSRRTLAVVLPCPSWNASVRPSAAQESGWKEVACGPG